MFDSRLYNLARKYRDALEAAELASIHDGCVVIFGAAPMPPDAQIHGSFIRWSVDAVTVHAVTEPVGADIERDTLLALCACARELRQLLLDFPWLGEWMLRWDTATGRVQIAARGATGHLIVAVAPQDAKIILANDIVHVGYEVGDDLIITASSPSGVAYA